MRTTTCADDSQMQRRYTIVLCHNGWPAEDIIKFDRLEDVDEWLISNFTPERRYRVRVDSPNEPTYYLTDKPTTVAGQTSALVVHHSDFDVLIPSHF